MAEEKNKKEKKIKFPADFNFKKYENDGVDISLLSCNLLRTPTERAENNKALLLIIEEAKKARKKRSHANP